jgi:Glycosyl transferase family 4
MKVPNRFHSLRLTRGPKGITAFAPLRALLEGTGHIGHFREPTCHGGLQIKRSRGLLGAASRRAEESQQATGIPMRILVTTRSAWLALGILALPFTVLWIVGVINAINLIDGLDGLDGLAGGVALFVVATSFILAFSRHDVLVSLAMASLGGAVLGFLIFNFNPASIFMGDTGSMFLGFVLAAIAVKTSTKSGTTVAMLVPVIALGLPITDTLLARIRRAVLGRSLFDADKEHIHHRLMSRLGLRQWRAKRHAAHRRLDRSLRTHAEARVPRHARGPRRDTYPPPQPAASQSSARRRTDGPGVREPFRSVERDSTSGCWNWALHGSNSEFTRRRARATIPHPSELMPPTRRGEN